MNYKFLGICILISSILILASIIYSPSIKVDPIWDAGGSYELCVNKTYNWTTQSSVYINKTIELFCDTTNKSESCDGQSLNGSWYKYYTYVSLDHYETIYHKEIICEPFGAISVLGKDYYFEGSYCKIIDGAGYCHDCTGDGFCQYGTKCREDDSQPCKIISLNNGEEITRDSAHFKDEIKPLPAEVQSATI